MRRATALAVIIRRLSWFNSIHFDAIHSWSLSRSHKLEKTLKPIFLKFKVIDVYTNKKLVTILLVMISSMSLPICNRFQATRANSGKIITCRFLKMYDRSNVQLNRGSTILIGLRHIGQPLSIDATVSAQLPQKRAWPHGTSATSERCAMRHTTHIWGSSARWGCGWCSIDGLSDGVVGVGRVVFVTGAATDASS